MTKTNKKLILLLVLVLTISTLVGCKKDAPSDVTQEFYDDMLDCFKKLEKHKDDKEKNGSDKIKEYLDNKIWLTHAEQEIIEAIDDMYFDVWFYYNSKEPNIHMVKDKIRKVADLMEVEIKSDKFITKK